MNKNTVEFGLKNVHAGTFDYNAQTETVTLGEPMHIPGAVSLNLSAEVEEDKFYADDRVYYASFTDNGETGELTMALFPDEFKVGYLPYIKLADGGIGKIKGESENIYLIFEGDGDKNKRRHILYNVALGAIEREHKTIEGNKEVEVETIGITLTGDPKTGLVKASYTTEDAGYETIFTNPPVPDITPAAEA